MKSCMYNVIFVGLKAGIFEFCEFSVGETTKLAG